MAKDIEVQAVYHDDLASRVRLYILAVLELARQLESEDQAPAAVEDEPAAHPHGHKVLEGGEAEPGERP
jgi:hypothetical protein